MSKIDLTPVREHFPALHIKDDGKERIYFDGAGGGQVPKKGLDALVYYLTYKNANEGGYFKTSVETTQLEKEARVDVAEFINADGWENIVTGPNSTALIYKLAWALTRILKPGDEIVTTRMEHGSNQDVWTILKDHGVVVKYIEVNGDECVLNYDMAEKLITNKTKIVTFGLASNVSGTINDVKRLVELAHDRNAWVYVDAVHYSPHGTMDVKDLNCDFLSFSMYKLFGPHGIAFMYGKKDILESLNPYRPWPHHDESPKKYDIGTPNMEGLESSRAIFEYVRTEIAEKFGKSFEKEYSEKGFTGKKLLYKMGMRAIWEYERGLVEHLNDTITKLNKVRIFGITDKNKLDWRVPTYSINFPQISCTDLCKALAKENIFVWNGEDGVGAYELAKYLNIIGHGGLSRISLEHYNTVEEIDKLIFVLNKIVNR